MKTVTVKLADIDEGLEKCNLCCEKLVLLYPDKTEYMFIDFKDMIWPYMDKIEKNLERHGGYMIDAWMFVDARQQPMHILDHVGFEMEKDTDNNP